MQWLPNFFSTPKPTTERSNFARFESTKVCHDELKYSDNISKKDIEDHCRLIISCTDAKNLLKILRIESIETQEQKEKRNKTPIISFTKNEFRGYPAKLNVNYKLFPHLPSDLYANNKIINGFIISYDCISQEFCFIKNADEIIKDNIQFKKTQNKLLDYEDYEVVEGQTEYNIHRVNLCVETTITEENCRVQKLNEHTIDTLPKYYNL